MMNNLLKTMKSLPFFILWLSCLMVLATLYLFVKNSYLGAISCLFFIYVNVDWALDAQINTAFAESIPDYPHRLAQLALSILIIGLSVEVWL